MSSDLPDAEARALISRWRDHHDHAAFRKLVEGHPRLLRTAVLKGGGKGRYDESMQEARLGLLRATEKFELWRPNRFWGYAFTWAYSFVQRFVIRDELVTVGGVTYDTRKKLALYRTEKILMKEGIEPTNHALAERTGISLEDVHMIQGYSRGGVYRDLYTELIKSSHLRLIDLLPNEDAKPPDVLLPSLDSFNEKIESFMKLLSDRDFAIFDQRLWTMDPRPLADIGDEFGVSRERIRQVESDLILKLAGYFRDELRAMGFNITVHPWPPKRNKEVE